jgi:hypothetical protein
MAVLKNSRKASSAASAANGRLGGRPKGSVNKATADIRLLAGKYGPEALKELFRLAKEAESESARVSAIKEILDRGFGKSPQPLSGDPDGHPIALQVSWLLPSG